MWLTIIMMLLSYFVQKKSGASTGKAALTAAAVGVGTHYVATETKWGQSVETTLESTWSNLTNSSGTAVTNTDGTMAKAPEGATPKVDANGEQLYDSMGNALFNLADNTVSTAGGVLKSWGATGTAAVLGTTALATSDDKKWLIYGAVAIAAIALLS